MYYTPQEIAVHSVMDRQNFRRGLCSAYDNPVLRLAPNFIFPTIMVKRLTTGDAPTVKLYRLTDDFISTLTPASVDNWPLDDLGEFEMMVLNGGNWTGFVPSDIIGTQCYLLIEAGAFTYYTDEFLVMESEDGFPPDCGETWAKLTFFLDGSCMVSGKCTDNQAIPIHTYPQTPIAHYVFWKANLSRPEWAQDEEGEEDAHGVLVVDSKRLVKTWVLEGAPVSESVSDAITVAAMADTVALEFSDGTVLTGITDIKTEVGWELGGCLASVKMKFTTDYIVKQGCC